MKSTELRIDEILKEKGKSAYWLANELGMGHGNMYKYRKGQMQSIGFDLLARMCVALECTPGELIVLVDEKKEGKKKAKSKSQK
jgi:putative transcriptional regulator